LFIALAVLLSGAALLPYLSLSSEPFSWQRYADVYEPGPVQVEITGFSFVPSAILIPVGTTVRWTNQGAELHTVTSDIGAFDSGTLSSGEGFEFQFNTLGSFPYRCTIHPDLMRGEVIVVNKVFDVFLPILLR
jgi:plastocyanin